MKTTVQDQTPVTKRIEVEIPPETVKDKEETSLREITRSATVRGFRKGKAPGHVIRQIYGGEVRKETLKTLMSDGLEEVIKTQDLDIVAVREMTPAPYKEGEPFMFAFVAEIMPRLEKVVYEGIEIEQPKTDVADALVDQRLDEIRDMHAEVRDLDPPRPALKGDLVTVGSAIWKDGAWKPQGPEKGYEIVVGRGNVPEEIESAIVGKSVGEIFEVSLKGKDDDQTARFQMSVRDVRARVLPALDDEFAKDVGDFATLEALRATIRRQLEEMATRNDEMSLRSRIMEKLREKNPMELPPSMVTEKMQESARMFGLPLESLPQDGEAIATIRKMASDAVHWTLLLREILRIDKLEVSDAEMDEHIRKEAEKTNEPHQKIRGRLQKEGGLESLRFRLLEDKIFAQIKSCIKIAAQKPEGGADHA